MKKKLELKGVNAKRIPPAKKEKMERTLATMQKVRDDDNRNLRNIIEAKLKWAIAEKERGQKTLDTLVSQISRIKTQMLKLEGITLVLKELLKPKKEEINDNDKA